MSQNLHTAVAKLEAMDMNQCIFLVIEWDFCWSGILVELKFSVDDSNSTMIHIYYYLKNFFHII